MSSNGMEHWKQKKMLLLKRTGFFASDLCTSPDRRTIRWLKSIIFECTQRASGSASDTAADEPLYPKDPLNETLQDALLESGVKEELIMTLSYKDVKRMENELQDYHPAELKAVSKLIARLNYPFSFFTAVLRHLRRYVNYTNVKYINTSIEHQAKVNAIGDLDSEMSGEYINVLKEDIAKVELVNQSNYWNEQLMISSYPENIPQKLAVLVHDLINETIPLSGAKRFPWLKADMFPSLMVYVWNAIFCLKEYFLGNLNSNSANVDSLLELPYNRCRLLAEIDTDRRQIEQRATKYCFRNADRLVDAPTSYLKELADATNAVAKKIHYVDVDICAKIMMRIWNNISSLDIAHQVLLSYNNEDSDGFRAISAELLSTELHWGPSVFYNGKIALVPLLLSEVKDVFETTSECLAHMDHRPDINGKPGNIEEFMAVARHHFIFGEEIRVETLRDRKKLIIERSRDLGVYSITPIRRYITTCYRRNGKNPGAKLI